MSSCAPLACDKLFPRPFCAQPKAQAAAAALRKIFPSVQATARRMAIPMPGHPVAAAEVSQVAADCDELSELVAWHDVVFLLTDSRESRWLPTLLATVCTPSSRVGNLTRPTLSPGMMRLCRPIASSQSLLHSVSILLWSCGTALRYRKSTFLSTNLGFKLNWASKMCANVFPAADYR